MQYEKYGTTELWFYYDSDGNPSGIRYKNGNTTADYYFVCNWRGDVVKIFDSTGSLVADYSYDSWGNVVSVTNSTGSAISDSTHIANVNPIRYRGYYYDGETGLYYVSSRYYNPETCRFINSDDDSLANKNYFAYCDNNPVVRADGEGDCWHIVIGAAVGCVLNATTQAIDQGGIHSKKDVAKIAVAAATGALSGGLAATGLTWIASGAIDTGLTMVSSLSIELIDKDWDFEQVKWGTVIGDTIMTAGTSFGVGGVYEKVTKKTVKKLDSAIIKGKNKIIKGITSNKSASKVKGTIKTGQKLMKASIRKRNNYRLGGSLIGSGISAAVSCCKTLAKRFIKWFRR